MSTLLLALTDPQNGRALIPKHTFRVPLISGPLTKALITHVHEMSQEIKSEIEDDGEAQGKGEDEAEGEAEGEDKGEKLDN